MPQSAARLPVCLSGRRTLLTRRVESCQPYRLNTSAGGEGMTLKCGDYYRPMSPAQAPSLHLTLDRAPTDPLAGRLAVEPALSALAWLRPWRAARLTKPVAAQGPVP